VPGPPILPIFREPRSRRFFPALALADLELDFAGIMVHVKGAVDWEIRRGSRYPACIHLIGSDSPGLTALFAIARRVRALLLN
jgi:hypothetical protein